MQPTPQSAMFYPGRKSDVSADGRLRSGSASGFPPTAGTLDKSATTSGLPVLSSQGLPTADGTLTVPRIEVVDSTLTDASDKSKGELEVTPG